MFKKLLIASAVLAVSTSVAFAANYKGEYKGEVAAPCPTYHPAVAPYLGLSLGHRLNYSSSSLAFSGLTGTLSLGYGGIVAPAWYFAGEIFVDGTVKLHDFAPSATSLKSTWDYGLSLIPGYMINDYLLGYIRVGVQNTRFSAASVNRTGWHVGLGGQTNVAPNWDLRAEYGYVYYGSNVYGAKPQSNSATVGLIYRFM